MIWSTEAWAIYLTGFGLFLLGMLSGEWFVSSLVCLGGYIVWLYLRLARLENWIRRGTKTSEVYDDDGFVGIIIRRLYEQKSAHLKRKRRTKRILHRLNQIISALPDATVLLNEHFQIEWCNEPARYLLNLRTPQDLGYKISNLIRDPELSEYLANQGKRDSVEIGAPMDPAISIQVRVVAFGDDKYLLIARNVSDQKMLRDSLQNFVANASHELKSPLTVILGHLEMLEAEDRLTAGGRQSLDTARRQADRMKELIEGLLLLSQVESYQLAPGEGERVAVTELMINVLAAVDKHAGKERLDVDYPPNLYLLGIAIEIEGICINLVENAIKYSAPDKPIRVRWAVADNGECAFSVADAGPGIDPGELTKITRRYYRGARSRAETSGSGLGLAIVQHAAAKHDARFEIDSTPGKGSLFRVIFPSYRCLHEPTRTAEIFQLADY